MSVALALLMSQAATAAMAFDLAPVSAEALDEARGGFSLPGGLQVEVAVRTDTLVDGQLRLRTEFSTAGAATTLSVAGPGASVVRDERGVVASLAQADFAVRHLVGPGYGAIVANRADNVAVDTVGQVDLTLSNASGLNLGSAGLRAEDLALASTAALSR